MGTNKLLVLSEEKESIFSITAPVLGLYSNLPITGEFINKGALVGKVRILNTLYHLYLPPNLSGTVINCNKNRDLIIPLEYHQELFSLGPDRPDQNNTSQLIAHNKNSKDNTPLEHGFAVTSFTTGIFYSSPSPDLPPFVTEGQQIEQGKVLGLIEVMKTFNHLTFQGTKNSDRGIIKKILVRNNQEVKLGESLFLIEDIGK